MTTKLEANNCLIIQILSYDRPTTLVERFYFLEMSTLQATTLLSKDKNIVSAKIVAYTKDNKNLDENASKNFRTIGDFNNFFINNPDYYIHNCDLELEDRIKVGSHDDGEVSIELPIYNSNSLFIESIFDKYNLDKTLINTLKNIPGHYIAIDKQSVITGYFKDFNDYLENGRG